MIKGNQYIKIEDEIKNIKNLEIEFDLKKVSDLEIEGEPNILIYNGLGEDEIELSNIFYSVKILITTLETIYKNKYEYIPEFVEYIIIDKKIYKNDKNNKIELSRFMMLDRFSEFIEETIRNNNYEMINSNNENILYIICSRRLIKRPNDLIIKFNKINYDYSWMLNMLNSENESVIHRAIINQMYDLANNIINLIKPEIINTSNKANQTILHWLCFYGYDVIFIKLIINIMSDEAIKKIDNKGRTALYWLCKSNNNIIDVMDKILERMDEESIKRDDIEGYNALYWTINNKREEMAIRILNRIKNKNEYVKRRVIRGEIIYNNIKKNGMTKIINYLKEYN